MKKKCIEELNVHSKKVEVKPPKIDIDVKEVFQETKENLSTFFYPASGFVFKNHKVIVDACLKLKANNITDYKVIFTLKGDESKHIFELYDIAKKNQLPIVFAGSLTKEEVFRLYSKSTLIYPSYIETVGLPLIEAVYHKTPIISSNSEYSHEILLDYDKVVYFECFNNEKLSKLMIEKIKLGKGVTNEI